MFDMRIASTVMAGGHVSKPETVVPLLYLFVTFMFA